MFRDESNPSIVCEIGKKSNIKFDREYFLKKFTLDKNIDPEHLVFDLKIISCDRRAKNEKLNKGNS